MRGGGFDFGDFEITKREILASVSIIAIMLIIGILISNKISEYQMDKNEIYNKAIKIDSKDLFQHGMDTNIGNAFVYGDLKAVDTVTFPEIGGQYMSVTKVKERYTQHTRTVTRNRKVGKTTQVYTTTETYWTWDAVDSWKKNCEKVSFLGIEFNYGDIYEPHEDKITTQKESSHIRYVYYGSPTKYTGTIFTELKNGTINNTDFFNNMTIDETVEHLELEVLLWAFWIIWIIVMGATLYGFYYLDNEWLE